MYIHTQPPQAPCPVAAGSTLLLPVFSESASPIILHAQPSLIIRSSQNHPLFIKHLLFPPSFLLSSIKNPLSYSLVISRKAPTNQQAGTLVPLILPPSSISKVPCLFFFFGSPSFCQGDNSRWISGSSCPLHICSSNCHRLFFPPKISRRHAMCKSSRSCTTQTTQRIRCVCPIQYNSAFSSS